MTVSPPLNVAMIGYAFMGAAHSQAWRNAPRFFDLPLTPVQQVICGRNPEALAAAAAKLDWRHTETDWRTAITREDVDLVDVCTPGNTHAEIAIAALEAGKHVLCEKPLALDPHDVDRIAAAATAAGVIVEEGFMYRHEPQTQRIVALLRDGAIGTVRAVVSGFTFLLEGDQNIRLRPSLGGGALWDVGSYPITFAQLIAGGYEPTMAFGTAAWTASGVDEEFMGLLRFGCGMTANVYAGFRAEYRTWLEVLGSSGALTVPNPFRPGPLEVLELERGGTVERIEVTGSPMIFVREIEDFEARILDGAPAVVTLDESRRTAATIAALYASAAENRSTDYTDYTDKRDSMAPRRRAAPGDA